MTQRIWILGASDPEMTAIERLLTEAGEEIAHAVDSSLNRVHPGNMYRGSFAKAGPETLNLVCLEQQGYKIYAVECDIPEHSATIMRIDHHRPGDPGYGLPPDQYWAASSIGQVWSALFPCGENHGDGDSSPYWDCPRCGQNPDYWDIDTTLLLTAAADHCLGAAYRGVCPGVDPKALAEWRAGQRAAFQDRPVEDIVADTERAKKLIREKANGGFADMTGSFIPELPEAACQLGIAVLAGPLDCPDGRQKIVLQSASAEQIRSFLSDELAPELVDKYGDPARGFAGGYRKD
jgi:hypothetical protein